MKIQKTLYLATACISLLLQPLATHGMNPADHKSKGVIAKKKRALEAEKEVIDGDTPADPRPPLTCVSAEVKNGFFYRTSDYKNMNGVYAKEAIYYDIDLFEDTENMHSFVVKQNEQNQYLGVVFFGIWSYPNAQEDSNFKETIKIIEVPIRKVKNKHMFYKTADGDFRFYPRLIWETGHGQERTEKIVIKGTTLHCTITPCRGRHTEKKFKMFIKDKKNKQALWEYFSHKSQEVKSKHRQLDVVGFKFYSSLDSCDKCFERIYKLQSNPEQILEDLLPEDILANRRIPFQLLFSSNSFYYPKNDGLAGSSLYFYPQKITPLIRLKGYDNNSKSYDCNAISNGAITEETIHHQDRIKFTENQQLTFIFLKVKDGEEEKVTLKAPLIGSVF